jgi:hypothetical protein
MLHWRTGSFWEDLWGGCVPKWVFPELLAKHKDISLQRAADIQGWIYGGCRGAGAPLLSNNFIGGKGEGGEGERGKEEEKRKERRWRKKMEGALLSPKSASAIADIDELQELLHRPIAFGQLDILLDNIDNCNLNNENNAWIYIWGSPFYSSQRAYKYMKGHRKIHPSFQWLWKFLQPAQIQKKIFWLPLKDYLNVRGMLRRRTMHLEDCSCVFYPCSEDEVIEHLFMLYPFARLCWNSIGLSIQPA